MSKNFVAHGKTVPVTNGGAAAIASGTAIAVGALVAVAITDILPGDTGDGFTEGVFLLPKLAADVITPGARVYLKAGTVQLASADAVAAGIAWEDAPATTTAVAVKINA